MTRSARIKRIVRTARDRAQQIRGRAKQTAGRATGNKRLRREGTAEVLKSRLHRLATRVKSAIKR